MTGRRSVPSFTAVSPGLMAHAPHVIRKRIRQASPEEQWGLGVARVVEIDPEEFLVSLQIVSGSSGDMVRAPIPLTFPGAGARHFLGAMPRLGDLCVVGWMPQESGNPRSKVPVILVWLPPGIWAGREWVTVSNFTVDEADLSAKKDRDLLEGFLARQRHKLRHMQPGNVLASSSQGSDLVLDEGVLLTNRRGNEIRLRDADQAFVLRALQEFHALSGSRLYAGMVQRDALLLPTTLVSDGKLWDGSLQATAGTPVHEGALAADPSAPEGFLTPTMMLARAEGSFVGGAALQVAGNVDPYVFLQNGGMLDANGFVVDARHLADAVYGGKPLYRVAATGTANAVLDPKAPTFTEYRVEVSHTSDGRLPVTEQTDLFDAERLPQDNIDGVSPNDPYIQMVLGSVIGNDPYTAKGRAQYGKPLVARVFDGRVPNPRLEAAILGTLKGSPATPVAEHAATLFQLVPISGKDEATFWSVNKKGQVRVFLAGPKDENSLEVALQGGMRGDLGGPLDLQVEGKTQLGTRSREGLHLNSPKGPVTIFGGGPIVGGEAVSERQLGQETDLPAVDIEGKSGVRIRSTRKVFLKGAVVEVNATATQVKGHEIVEVTSGGKVGISASSLGITASGKITESFSGPLQGLPTSGPLHERTYTPTLAGMVCEKVTYQSGDREETFEVGNHKTTVVTGTVLYEVQAGTFTAKAATASMELASEGITGTADAGDVVLSAVAGSASFTGQTDVLVSSPLGQATVQGDLGVYLGGPETEIGSILVSGSLEPLTGKPFSTWGMGAKSFNIGAMT